MCADRTDRRDRRDAPGPGDDGLAGARRVPGPNAVPGPDARPDPDSPARAALGRARAAARALGRPRGRPGAGPRGVGSAGSRTGSGSAAPYSAGRDPVPVGDTLERFMAERGWSSSVSVAGVLGRWRELVGDQVADHCEPESFDEGALVLRADSTAWALEIRRLLPQLERRLAEEVGEGVVGSITVRGPSGPRWSHGPRSVRGRGPRDTYG